MWWIMKLWKWEEKLKTWDMLYSTTEQSLLQAVYVVSAEPVKQVSC